MSRRNLPPLEVGTAYVAADFERFEFAKDVIHGSKAILRLHLKNGTTIDLPTDDDALKHLLRMLCDAYGPAAVEHLCDVRHWALRKAD